MAGTVKETVADAGQMVADAAKAVGHAIASGAGQAADFVKDKTGIGGAAEDVRLGGTHINEGMEVISADGRKVGVVQGMEGETIKLTSADGQTRTVPAKWVERADNRIRLKKTEQETEQGWKAAMGD